ncbi:MAG: hypothetical protein SPiBPW_35010 [Shewanella algae]
MSVGWTAGYSPSSKTHSKLGVRVTIGHSPDSYTSTSKPTENMKDLKAFSFTSLP